jgi:RNA polymerase sigma-70 factor (ECF subfamily)
VPIRSTASTALPVLSAATITDLAGRRTELENEVVELFDRFREPLLRYMLGFGLTIQDGEEVIQDVFIALFEHLQGGKSRANLRGWLFRVAHNLALKRRYRSRRSPEVWTNASEEDVRADPSPSPEDQLVNTQIRHRLLAVVQALPELDRRCLALRAEGLRYREIAAILNISLGAVSLSLARSLARIARSAEL